MDAQPEDHDTRDPEDTQSVPDPARTGIPGEYPWRSADQAIVDALQELDWPLEISAQVGPYTILDRIGIGGMGAVYLAERAEPLHKYVALKVIKKGFGNAETLARFKAESQALALMNHRNVARVLDAGTTASHLPYFVMDYVPGEPITRFCNRHRVTTRERLELFIQVCDGVQHAHQKGVIHRDIKPANVLVTVENDERVPKVIDFGLVKAISQPLVHSAIFTDPGRRMGTPEYMSPEQAENTPLDIDTRTDVYSLGVLLYELLCGAMPFDSRQLRNVDEHEMKRILREEQPPSPGDRLSSMGPECDHVACERATDREHLLRAVRAELDDITMMAMEKDRVRRYPTAQALADDVRRYLSHEPSIAGRRSKLYSRFYLLRKFVRRNRGPVTTVAGVVLALTIGLVLTGVMYTRSEVSRARADDEARAARFVSDYLLELFASANPTATFGEDVPASELLARGRARIAALDDLPVIQARVMHVMGRAYAGIGRFYDSRALLEQALALRQAHLQAPHADIAASAVALGAVEAELDNLAAAERWHREGLRQYDLLNGPYHNEVMQAQLELGWALYRSRSFPEARAMFERAVERGRELLKAQSRGGIPTDRLMDIELNLATALRRLGRCCLDSGDLEMAEVYLDDALAMRTRLLDPRHVDLAVVELDLGLLMSKSGRHDQAEALVRRALQKFETTKGSNHAHRAACLDSLAHIKWQSAKRTTDLAVKAERLAEAEALSKEALRIDRLSAMHGGMRERQAQHLSCRAAILRDLQRFEESATLLREAIALRREQWGAESAQAARSLGSLALTQLARARVLKEHSDNKDALDGLFAEAEAALREGHAISLHHGSADDVQWYEDELRNMYEDWGREPDPQAITSDHADGD